mmetsp:Transcript_132319/g.233304  ORF Transcript_132319/g.233304 Transcript_132319/m.233304 type:complete len:86 (-) Transcript_132319:42-299(-)
MPVTHNGNMLAVAYSWQQLLHVHYTLGCSAELDKARATATAEADGWIEAHLSLLVMLPTHVWQQVPLQQQERTVSLTCELRLRDV